MRFIKPLSTSSVMAANSLLCRRHQAVLSGIELGITDPKALSNLVLVCLPRPPRTRALFLKNNVLFMALSAWKKPQVLARRNQLWREAARFWTCFNGAPDPSSAKQLPVPYPNGQEFGWAFRGRFAGPKYIGHGCTHGNNLAS